MIMTDKKVPIDDPEIGPKNPTLSTTSTSEAANNPDEEELRGFRPRR